MLIFQAISVVIVSTIAVTLAVVLMRTIRRNLKRMVHTLRASETLTQVSVGSHLEQRASHSGTPDNAEVARQVVWDANEFMARHRKKGKLRVTFTDFWSDFFYPHNNFFLSILSAAYHVEVCEPDDRPDVCLFSLFGENHRRVRCKKYHMSGEPFHAPPDTYDYSFTFDPTGGKNLRLPLWWLYIDWFETIPILGLRPRDLAMRKVAGRDKFCNFIYSNHSGPRVEFLDALSRWRHVDSFGPLRRNKPFPGGGFKERIKAKVDLLREYRFTIAFENRRRPGYVSEKLLHGLATGGVAIYWGAKEAASDFNPAAFIDAKNFPSLEALAERVMEIENKPDLWAAYASAPMFNGPMVDAPSIILDFFQRTL